MNSVIDQIIYLIGQERAEAYKMGFSDGIKYIREGKNNIENFEKNSENF